MAGLLALLGACGGTDSDMSLGGEQTGSSAQAVVTDVIPTSTNCSRGEGPGYCVSVPVVKQPVPWLDDESAGQRGHLFRLDGKRDGAEYQGAVSFPYVNNSVRAGGGRVYVLPERYGIGGSGDDIRNPAGQLHVYLEHIPVPVDQRGGMFAGDQGQQPRGLVVLGVDNRRFTGPTEQAGREDQLYAVDLVNGVVDAAYRRGNWMQGWHKTNIDFGFVRGGCEIDENDQTHGVMRCDAELTLPLPGSAFTAPDQGLDPGIGFMVTASTKTSTGGSNSQAAVPGTLPKIAEKYRVTRRDLWQTLLFGPPKGFQLSYMSWNVRRSSTMPLRITDTKDNNNMARKIGERLAPYDVVALQEVWNDEQAHWILEAANDERTKKGLPPFKIYGGKGFGSTAVSAWAADAAHDLAGYFTNDNTASDGATNGLYILTSLQKADESYIIYDACKGEDCFKPKGAQWLRLYLNPPSEANSDDCRARARESGENPCGLPPSGGDFVDIFNTHTQASNPSMCSMDIVGAFGDVRDKLEEIWAGIISPPTWVASRLAPHFDCNIDDVDIRRQQFRQLNEFVAGQIGEFGDRPAIIMGDFNVDGKNIEPGAEYAEMLHTLKIGPSPSVTSDDGFTSDIINPWRFDFDWDIDHGDVARERRDIDWNDPRCVGTFVGKGTSDDNAGAPDASCTLDGQYGGGGRLDYILVRPPRVPNAPDYESAAFVVGKVEGEPVWRSPWPGAPGNFGPVPERLSDHKPIVATLTHVRLKMPSPFHPTWNHDVHWRVSSLNGGSMSDCDGPVDPLVRLHWGLVQQQLGRKELGTHKGATCADDATVSYQADGCTYDWHGVMRHDGADTGVTASYMWAQAWDADTGWCGSDDDMSFLCNTSQPPTPFGMCFPDLPIETVEWNAKRLTLAGMLDGKVRSVWKEIKDNEPISRSTDDFQDTISLRFNPIELPPGKQF